MPLSDDEIDAYLRAGAIAREALQLGISLARPGSALLDIAESVEGLIRDRGAGLAFPVNISRNEQAAHYTPFPGDASVLRPGDVIKLDVGAHVEGLIADTADTVEVGSSRHSDLIQSAREALEVALASTRAGADLSEVGGAVESVISAAGFRPVENLRGHMLRRYELHAGIHVPSVRERPGNRIPADGVALAVEPFASTGRGRVEGMGDSHIHRLLPAASRRDECAPMWEATRGLPFSERAAQEILGSGASKILRRWRARRLCEHYEVLGEPGAIIAQAEHTILVFPDRTIVTTR